MAKPNKKEPCPSCGRLVDYIFAHVDIDCESMSDEQVEEQTGEEDDE